nr:MAG TPA: hypothetical protein [Caudoviricetes sp.]
MHEASFEKEKRTIPLLYSPLIPVTMSLCPNQPSFPSYPRH